VKVSAIKPHAEQSAIWPWVGDHAFASMAETRNACGEFYEEATRAMLGADRHQTDGTADVCPDLSVGRNRFLEVKSIGCSRQGLVYSHRLDRDRQLLKSTRGQLTYLFWIHNVRASECSSLFELRDALATGVECVLAVPFETLWEATRALTPRVMNYRAATGSKPRQEMEGYRLPWGLLRDLSAGQTTMTWSVVAFGREVPPTPLHCRDLARLQRAATR
jgi:hypothetical protein